MRKPKKEEKPLQYYVKYAKINLVTIWKSKEIHSKSWRITLQDNIKEEKMASRRTEKQNMLRAYEAELKEKVIQEELECRQEEEAYYYSQLYQEYKEEERQEEERKHRQLEIYIKELYQIEMLEAMHEQEAMLRRMQGHADY